MKQNFNIIRIMCLLSILQAAHSKHPPYKDVDDKQKNNNKAERTHKTFPSSAPNMSPFARLSPVHHTPIESSRGLHESYVGAPIHNSFIDLKRPDLKRPEYISPRTKIAAYKGNSRLLEQIRKRQDASVTHDYVKPQKRPNYIPEHRHRRPFEGDQNLPNIENFVHTYSKDRNDGHRILKRSTESLPVIKESHDIVSQHAEENDFNSGYLNDQAGPTQPKESGHQNGYQGTEQPPAFGLFATVQEIVLTVKDLYRQQELDRKLLTKLQKRVETQTRELQEYRDQAAEEKSRVRRLEVMLGGVDARAAENEADFQARFTKAQTEIISLKHKNRRMVRSLTSRADTIEDKIDSLNANREQTKSNLESTRDDVSRLEQNVVITKTTVEDLNEKLEIVRDRLLNYEQQFEGILLKSEYERSEYLRLNEIVEQRIVKHTNHTKNRLIKLEEEIKEIRKLHNREIKKIKRLRHSISDIEDMGNELRLNVNYQKDGKNGYGPPVDDLDRRKNHPYRDKFGRRLFTLEAIVTDIEKGLKAIESELRREETDMSHQTEKNDDRMNDTTHKEKATSPNLDTSSFEASHSKRRTRRNKQRSKNISLHSLSTSGKVQSFMKNGEENIDPTFIRELEESSGWLVDTEPNKNILDSSYSDHHLRPSPHSKLVMWSSEVYDKDPVKSNNTTEVSNVSVSSLSPSESFQPPVSRNMCQNTSHTRTEVLSQESVHINRHIPNTTPTSHVSSLALGEEPFTLDVKPVNTLVNNLETLDDDVLQIQPSPTMFMSNSLHSKNMSLISTQIPGNLTESAIHADNEAPLLSINNSTGIPSAHRDNQDFVTLDQENLNRDFMVRSVLSVVREIISNETSRLGDELELQRLDLMSNMSSLVMENLDKTNARFENLEDISDISTVALEDLQNRFSSESAENSDHFSGVNRTLEEFSETFLTPTQLDDVVYQVYETIENHTITSERNQSEMRSSLSRLESDLNVFQAVSQRWYTSLQGHMIRLNNSAQDMKESLDLKLDAEEFTKTVRSPELDRKIESLHVQLLYNANRLAAIETAMLNASLVNCKRTTEDYKQKDQIETLQDNQSEARREIFILKEKIKQMDMSLFQTQRDTQLSTASLRRLSSEVKQITPALSTIQPLKEDLDKLVRMVQPDCHAYFELGHRKTGVYTIRPGKLRPVRVLCIMDDSHDSTKNNQMMYDGSKSKRQGDQMSTAIGNKDEVSTIGVTSKDISLNDLDDNRFDNFDEKEKKTTQNDIDLNTNKTTHDTNISLKGVKVVAPEKQADLSSNPLQNTYDGDHNISISSNLKSRKENFRIRNKKKRKRHTENEMKRTKRPNKSNHKEKKKRQKHKKSHNKRKHKRRAHSKRSINKMSHKLPQEKRIVVNVKPKSPQKVIVSFPYLTSSSSPLSPSSKETSISPSAPKGEPHPEGISPLSRSRRSKKSYPSPPPSPPTPLPQSPCSSRGGWTVIQIRHNDKANFTRSWEDYAGGFGDVEKGEDHWIGNQVLHELTSQEPLQLRIIMEDVFSTVWEASYAKFRVGSRGHKYRVKIDGYHGNATDGLGSADGSAFSTYDQSNTETEPGTYGQHCAKYNGGGWWYPSCHASNLNGQYRLGMLWFNRAWMDWVQMRSSTMMVRPRSKTKCP